ncbi:3638_t:CDS:1, partial [Paraglomus occultum]
VPYQRAALTVWIYASKAMKKVRILKRVKDGLKTLNNILKSCGKLLMSSVPAAENYKWIKSAEKYFTGTRKLVIDIE